MGKRIVIVGGHGQIALLTAPLLVAAGHHVTSVIRNRDHVGAVHRTGAVPVISDIEGASQDELLGIFASHETVIWSAGAGGGNPDRTYAVDRDGAINTIGAAIRARIQHYIMVSYIGSGLDDIPANNSFRHYAVAKAAADDYLRASRLPATILGPSRLIDTPATGHIEIGDQPRSVSRADVAAVIAATVDEPLTIGHTIRFNSGNSPIASAITNCTASRM